MVWLLIKNGYVAIIEMVSFVVLARTQHTLMEVCYSSSITYSLSWTTLLSDRSPSCWSTSTFFSCVLFSSFTSSDQLAFDCLYATFSFICSLGRYWCSWVWLFFRLLLLAYTYTSFLIFIYIYYFVKSFCFVHLYIECMSRSFTVHSGIRSNTCSRAENPTF